MLKVGGIRGNEAEDATKLPSDFDTTITPMPARHNDEHFLLDFM
jgi:hypothetical protein